MQLPLAIQYTKAAAKYLESLDGTMRQRIKKKVAEVAASPDNPACSLPLKCSDKRKGRVGSYRILFLIEADTLIVADIGPRGQVYRNA